MQHTKEQIDRFKKAGINPRKLRRVAAGTTHLRVQSVCGRAFGKAGYVFAHNQQEDVPLDELSPEQVHEMLGEHLADHLRVEQVAIDDHGRADIVGQAPKRPEPPAEMSKEQLVAKAESLGISVGRKGKNRLEAEVEKREAELKAEKAAAQAAKAAEKSERRGKGGTA